VTPLIFDPIYKPKIWGGRSLETVLGKKLPSEEPIGESWEIADLEHDQSVVRLGPNKGSELGDLVKKWGADLLGRAKLFEGRFPLLIKFLDAQQHLSVQVHPDEAMANRLGGSVRVKNEAWYVLHAEPDGRIYRGFNESVTPAAFRDAIQNGAAASLLRHIPVKTGQCYYLPSGTIHALGAGVLVAEVQTPSDTTYRVYDWDRVEPDSGKPRDLHIDQAMECIRFQPDDGLQQSRSHVASVWTTVTQVARCDSFVMEHVRMVEGVEQDVPVGELIVWIMLDGRAEVAYPDGEPISFTRGDTVLIPAGLKSARIKTLSQCKWIEVTIPLPSDLSEFPRPDRKELQRPEDRGVIPLNIHRDRAK
jgi:mannose-6-phosphate isomerase